MLKDFMPVREEGHDETAFVEDFWSGQLSGGDLSAYSEKLVTTRDEFPILSRCLSGLPDGARILDGGCGRGEWTVYLQRKGFDVVGLDISKKLVDRLGELFPDCTFTRGDLRDTGYEASSFDLLFSWGAFEHFELGLGPCMTEAARLVKPGGYLVISVPYANVRQRRKHERDLRRGADKMKEGEQRFYQWRFRPGEFKRELALHGFDVLELMPIHKPEGLRRMMEHDFGVKLSDSLPARLVLSALNRLIPASYAAHMLLAVGKRTAN